MYVGFETVVVGSSIRFKGTSGAMELLARGGPFVAARSSGETLRNRWGVSTYLPAEYVVLRLDGDVVVEVVASCEPGRDWRRVRAEYVAAVTAPSEEEIVRCTHDHDPCDRVCGECGAVLWSREDLLSVLQRSPRRK